MRRPAQASATMARAALFCLGLLPGAAASAQQPALDATLCNFPVEGLTLQSTKAQVDAVFGPLGWHDLSEVRRPGDSQSRRLEEAWQYRRLPPETAEEARKRTMANISRYDGGFTLSRIDGRPFALTFGESYVGEDDAAARGGRPGLLERARALCAMADPRFRLRGCHRIKPGSNLVQVTLEPVAPRPDSCTVTVSGGEGNGLSVSVSLNDRSLQPKTGVR